MESLPAPAKLGTLEILRRYPFKGMAGEDLNEVFVTYAGLAGDRAYAFIDPANPSSFPWMTGRIKREMILFRPRFLAPPDPAVEYPPSKSFSAEVATPEGQTLAVDDPAFTPFFEKRFGRKLELRFSERAMQDACPVSLIGLSSVQSLGEETGIELDHQRFRANFYVRWEDGSPFYENDLVGARLRIGEKLTVMIVKKDARCVIITLDPSTAEASPQVLAVVAKNHANCSGVYGSILREGIVRAGDAVYAV
ncbi:MAG TPA: MOSC domain-containing protein [Candidatus Limnocylindrales bacterium]|nr:MOSC domain-containing protein [Candidatus Limnocylindrales bacterium]